MKKSSTLANCEFGNVVVLVGFLDVLHVDGLQLVRVVEVDISLGTQLGFKCLNLRLQSSAD